MLTPRSRVELALALYAKRQGDPEPVCRRCGHVLRLHSDPSLPAGPWCARCAGACAFAEARP